MDDKVLGKNAETVFRDKRSGRRRDLSAEREEEEAEAARKAAEDKKYKEWGQGWVHWLEWVGRRIYHIEFPEVFYNEHPQGKHTIWY